MRGVKEATLSEGERAVLDRFVTRLRSDLSDRIRAVWLFGSRARGERVASLSDVDVLVIADRGGFAHSAAFYDALHGAARELGLDEVAWTFSIHVHDEPWLQRRREDGTPFVEELERDRIDLVP